MADWDNPPTTFTLAQAIAELKRIGPVYSAATRSVDRPDVARTDKLAAAVRIARPVCGPHVPDLGTAIDDRTEADWATITGVP